MTESLWMRRIGNGNSSGIRSSRKRTLAYYGCYMMQSMFYLTKLHLVSTDPPVREVDDAATVSRVLFGMRDLDDRRAFGIEVLE